MLVRVVLCQKSIVVLILYIFIGAVAAFSSTDCFLGTAHHQVHSASNEAAVVTIHRKEATNHPRNDALI